MIDPIITDIRKSLNTEYGFQKKGDFLRGKCPACDKKEAWTRADRPFVVFCNRGNKCGERFTARELFPNIFDNFSKRYPTTKDDPDATARAYLLHNRGFDLASIRGRWRQGTIRIDDRYRETVRFLLWEGHYWERIIDNDAIRRLGYKAHFSAGSSYAGRHWQVDEQLTLAAGERCFIVEGIFHAIALTQAGKKAVASFSSNNFPRKFVETHRGKGIIWCLAFDNDPVGRKRILTNKKKLDDLKEQVEVHLAPKGLDWDECLQREEMGKKSFWSDCLHRGRLLTAKDAVEMAWILYLRYRKSVQLVEFGNELHTIKFEDNSGKLAEYMANLGDEPTEAGLDIFRSNSTIRRISNCVHEFLHIEHDPIMDEQIYAFRIRYGNGNPDQIIRISGHCLENPASWNKALLTHAKFGTFDGALGDLKALKSRWIRRVFTISSLPFLGYDKSTGTYVFQEFAIRQGKEIPFNENGYFELNKRVGIKTKLKTIHVHKGDPFDPFWWSDFRAVFGRMGLVALGNLVGTLFVQQIRARYESWPFLEITGAPGSGKSTLIEVLWKLIGRDGFEGIDPVKATFSNRRRTFSQGSNWPVVLIEADRHDERNISKQRAFSFDELKPLYNGRGVGGTGLPQRGAETEEPTFQGTLIISQNLMVEGSEALMERIVHIDTTKGHKRPENRPRAMRLRTMPVKQLSGFLPHVLFREEKILSLFDAVYARIYDDYQRRGQITNDRIIHNHAQIAASVQCLEAVLPMEQGWIDDAVEYLHGRALDRQDRLGGDPPLVTLFWENVDYLKSALDCDLNCSQAEKEIWINLPEYHKVTEDKHLPRIDPQELRRQLPLSRSRPLQKNGRNVSARCRRHGCLDRRGYIDPMDGQTVKVWKFDTK
uniref:Toprim-like n=1 Tax=Candidatus Kentrum sp. LFY TaxID=2126342 RepID=A0A450WT64_9GAMM|nr:MAG: Toprim-like [Candidatus Kentron sp. LFY]